MPLSWNDIKSRAIGFSKDWADAADERAQTQHFWIELFAVFGLSPKRLAAFEHAVKKHGGGKGFVDLFWPGMLMVEHKSRGKSLDRAYGQALDYFPGIAERDLPRYILVSDFARLRITDLVNGDEAEFALADLHKHIRRFAFIAGYQVQEIKPQDPVNLKAAERMGRLHDALKASGFEGHPLEVLLVRLLFCLFADDTGIFQPAQAFRGWVEERSAEDGSDLGPQLAALFQVLNTPEAKRSKALDEQLAAFPYVNGALFAEALPLAAFDRAMRDSLLDACAIDWSAISPAIFGALFQSIMDARARRNLGAHYTSEENILKLIKPLFLDELWSDFHKVNEDNGAGMPDHMLSKVFEMFTQVDRPLERSKGGLGIGLSLVRRLVEMHGGSVQASSDGDDKGSAFVVRLPVVPAVGVGREPCEAESVASQSRQRILVVDDNQDAANSLASLLKMMGHETEIAYDGLQALKAAAAFRPDVALLDIGMPEVNGYEVCRRMRQEAWGENMVLLALTGWGEHNDRRRSLAVGFDAHLVKPVSLADLQKLLAGATAAKD